MPKLKPYRQYSEYDVINGLFSFAGNQASAGTIVKIVSNYKEDNNNDISDFSELSSIDGTVSSLFSCVGKVAPTVNFDDDPLPIGIILKDVAEYDENGIPLIFEPRKAAERNIILPHQAVPILTKGIILINDIDTNTHTLAGGGAPAPGDPAYLGNNGLFATDGVVKVGQFLSTIDADGYVLVRFGF